MNIPVRIESGSPAEAALLVISEWQRREPVITFEGFSFPTSLGIREGLRSRARVCWQTARGLRKYVREHAWHLSSDDVENSLEHARDLRKEAAEFVRASRRALQHKIGA